MLHQSETFVLIKHGQTYDLNKRITDKKWLLVDSPEQLQSIGKFDAIAVDLHTDDLSATWIKTLADATLHRIPVYHTATLYESSFKKVLIEHISKIHLEKFRLSRLEIIIKRLFDIAFVIVTSPAVLPCIFLIAILIRLESEGNALFTQQRAGQGGKDFTMYKLRSMRKDSEKNGAQFADRNDSRITRIGKFIRKTRIDELPQFLNILKGDMSLIGPRPEQTIMVRELSKEIPFYDYRLLVKPGITGWAQTTQGYAASTDETREKLAYDLYYIKHYSTWLDIKIVFKTIWTMMTGFGAR